MATPCHTLMKGKMHKYAKVRALEKNAQCDGKCQIWDNIWMVIQGIANL
jgi:hypothetical protein